MAQDVFGALASPIRRTILETLIDGPKPAGEIASAFQLNRPAVSEHLQVLRHHGLVRETVVGRHHLYSLDPDGLKDVAAWLKPFEVYWRARIAALEATLDEEMKS